MWIGNLAFKMKSEDIDAGAKKEVSRSNSIYTGFALAITSPLAVFVGISIGGAYLAQYPSRTMAFINILLLAFGVMLFFFSLASLIHITRHKISTKYVLLFSKIFGVVLIGYGVYFWYQLLTLM